MNNIVLLSEIHQIAPSLVNRAFPNAGVKFNALFQAINWYPFLFNPEDELWVMNSIHVDNTLDIIQSIAQRVAAKEMSLVIRDWPHLDFIGKPYLQHPTYQMSMQENLHTHFSLHEAFIVRHPIAQFLSMINSGSAHDYMKDETGVKHFLRGYRAFAEIAKDGNFIRYEDFISSPECIIEILAGQLNINFDPAYTERWKHYTNITGDTKRMASQEICRENYFVFEKVYKRFFVESADFKCAIELLGYEEDL
ncbi:MAG: hypothetical protein GXP23_10280 [Gammaproteobacteria bacterium]|nr:hypothetical protein [Gammaproteobacteria bacterium]